VFGSFLNVVVMRDAKRQTIVAGRSACPHCGHQLRWFELIPVFSWLLQGGRCRSCKHRISVQYIAAELSCALLTVFIAQFYLIPQLISGESIAYGLVLLLAFWVWFVVALQDIKTQTVRIEYVIVAGLIGAVGTAGTGALTVVEVLFGGLLAGGSIAAVIGLWYLVRREWGMGDGDIWIAMGLGVLLGWQQGLVMLITAVFMGMIGGLITIALSKLTMRATIPFGPYLIGGALVALVWGEQLISWYTMYYSGAVYLFP
jgi:leader peptidase (prepilin peptidase) / N-methyltransferase